jgi:hypothetical protein
VILGAHLLVCQMSTKQVWSQNLAVQQPSCFFSIMCHGEAFHRLGVQGVKVLILLASLFPPSVAQHLSEVLKSQSLPCLLLCPSHHLGSLCKNGLMVIEYLRKNFTICYEYSTLRYLFKSNFCICPF